MSRATLVMLALWAGSALAEGSITGWGRATVEGGYRWVPNWYFAQKAADAGYGYTSHPQGGPSGVLSFGYGAASWIEVAVDLFAAWEPFSLDQLGGFNAVTYGATVGARAVGSDVLFRGFMPFAGVGVGPVLADLLSKDSTVSVPEKLMTGVMVVGGFHWKLNDRWAITFDVRWLLARGVMTGISGLNVGGVTGSLGVSYFFTPSPQRDLEVPGFGSPSNLPD